MKPYTPQKLPIEDIDWGDLISLVGEANAEVARFDGLLRSIPNSKILLTPLKTQEAVLSSKIEGTQANIKEVLDYEADPKQETEKYDDIQEILNYRKAMDYAVEKLDDLPLSTRLIKNIHEILMQGVRGKNKKPGEFRDIQVHIGTSRNKEEARYVPPTPNKVDDCMKNLDEYINSKEKDILVQLAIIHAQFEVIHPFIDGNGRVGRIIMPLFLYCKDVLSEPMLYLSEYFETNRQEYYDRLLAVSQDQDWSGWIKYFLQATIEQTKKNTNKAQEIQNLYDKSKDRIVDITNSKYAIQALDALFDSPIFTTAGFKNKSNIPKASASRILQNLENKEFISILQKSSGRSPNKYVFPELFSIVHN